MFSRVAGKLVFCYMFIVYAFMGPLTAQENTTKSALYPGLGFGIGIFYPSDVNDYINDDMAGYYQQAGTYNMFLYLGLHGSLTYKIKWFDMAGIAEYAIAPKFIFISNTSEIITYNFHRFSPGLLANFHIPMKSERHEFLLGGGAQYHWMKFEDFKGENIGFMFQAGVNFNLSKVILQPHLAVNLAKAEGVNTQGHNNCDLNYSGVQIGLNIFFSSHTHFND